ncbi:hypothetical protein P9B03_04115 [Metasolibacillus meyeri]|uniref:Uncharacterized protein n=1 Tax=Metasolibacillus meyeri TaxID=1071052 RepID=A0AAW9NJR7_9BACL|nr:hypothetical protein [Metasolibacillus meyeri]MEC1177660.1 hypothetical protein [Metasolibacillus meyeri]
MGLSSIEEFANSFEVVNDEHIKKIARQLLELLEQEEVSVHRARLALAQAYNHVDVFSKVTMDPKES